MNSHFCDQFAADYCLLFVCILYIHFIYIYNLYIFSDKTFIVLFVMYIEPLLYREL